MYKDFKFFVFIVYCDIKVDIVVGECVWGIVYELEQDGFSIFFIVSFVEGCIVVFIYYGLVCILVVVEGVGENQCLLQDVVELICVVCVWVL